MFLATVGHQPHTGCPLLGTRTACGPGRGTARAPDLVTPKLNTEGHRQRTSRAEELAPQPCLPASWFVRAFAPDKREQAVPKRPDSIFFLPSAMLREALASSQAPAAAALLNPSFPSGQTGPNRLLKEDLILLFSSQSSQKITNKPRK